jgi:Protein of unknown function (DUF1488)
MATERMEGMPLTRARENYTVRSDGIWFLMRDGQAEVICHIGPETLSDFGNATDPMELVEIFDRSRAAIEDAASRKYDQTSRRDYEIVTVTAVDLTRP